MKFEGVGRKVNVRKKDGSLMPSKLFITRKQDGNSTFFTGILQEIDD